MSLEDTVDDDRIPFAKRYEEALAQTISEEEFSAMAIQTIAEDWGRDNGEDRVQGVMYNLLETIDDAEYSNEIDFTLASEDVTISGSGIGEDPFEEQPANRYVIKGVLGSGGMGQVFDVHDASFQREVAVKFLHPKAVSEPHKMEEFFREAKLTARLEHPNILPVHDVNISDGGMPYFSMRKARGESLRELLDESKPPISIPEPIEHFNDRVAIIVKLCDAIAYAHSQGIIHQDIKPSNIMIGDYGEVVLVDWGTARNLNEEVAVGKAKLQGTPIYMSPEQARREFATELSDIYCIGATLFHLLTFRFPTWSDDPEAFWDLKRKGIVSEATEDEQREIPPALLSIAYKAMSFDPDDRYQSVLELRQDLINYQRGLKVSAHKDTTIEVVKRIYRLNKRAFWVACAMVVMVLALAFAVYQEVMKSQSEWREVALFDFENMSTTDLENDWNGYHFYRFDEQKVYPLPINTRSPWSVKEGALVCDARNTGERYFNLSYKHHVHGDMRIEWDVLSKEDRLELSCFIGASNRFDGYMFHLNGNSGATYRYLTKQEQFVDQVISDPLVSEEIYHLCLEKDGEYVRLYINDVLNFEYRDIDVFQGPGHQTFGFEALHGTCIIDNIRISSRPLPQKISPIMVANSLYANNRYQDAVDHYLDISRAYPGTDLDAIATFRRGRAYNAMHSFDEALVAFNDFRYRFSDHPMMGYALREIGLVYANKGNWDLAGKHFDDVAANYQDRSLRVSTYQAIEKELWDIINPEDWADIAAPNALERAKKAEYLMNSWSERLDVDIARFNNIKTKLGIVFIAYGEFDKVLEEYDMPYWPWNVIVVARVTGRYDEVFKRLDTGKFSRVGVALLEKLGDFDRMMELFPGSSEAKRSYYLAKKPLEIADAFPNPKDYIYAELAMRNGDYDSLIANFSHRHSLEALALVGLKRYEEVTPDRFKNLDGWIDLASVLNGREVDVIAKGRAYSLGYKRALASLIIKSAIRNDNAAVQKYSKQLTESPFLIDWQLVDNGSFAQYLLPMAMRSLINGDSKSMQRHVEQLLLDDVVGQIALVRAVSKLYLGRQLTREEVASFTGLEISIDFVKALEADIAGKTRVAYPLYQAALKRIPQHMRTYIAQWCQWRLSVIRP